MASPESITVDLKHAKMLKEAGWPQKEALLWWSSRLHPDPYDESLVWQLSNDDRPIGTHDWCKQAGTFAAPTAEEILRRLPLTMQARPLTMQARYDNCGRVHWGVCYIKNEKVQMQWQDTLANAAAQMWCYLKKNNLLPS